MEISDLLKTLENFKTDLARKKRMRTLSRSPLRSNPHRSTSPHQKSQKIIKPVSNESMRSNTPLFHSYGPSKPQYNIPDMCATERTHYSHVPRSTLELLERFRYPKEKLRTYKLDAAQLIFSCIKRFICKHLWIWKKEASKRTELILNSKRISSSRTSINEKPEEISFKDTTMPVWFDANSIDGRKYRKVFSANASLRVLPENNQEMPRNLQNYGEKKSVIEVRKVNEAEISSPVTERKSIDLSPISKELNVFNRTEGYVKIIWVLNKAAKKAKRDSIEIIKIAYRKDLVTKTLLCYTEKMYKNTLKVVFKAMKETNSINFLMKSLKKSEAIQTSLEEQDGKKTKRIHRRSIEDFSSGEHNRRRITGEFGMKNHHESPDFSISNHSRSAHENSKRNHASNFFSSLEDTDPILVQDYLDHSEEHTARTLQQYIDQQTERTQGTDHKDVVESLYYKKKDRKAILDTQGSSKSSSSRDHSQSIRKVVDNEQKQYANTSSRIVAQFSYETLDKTERADSKRSSANSSFAKSLPLSQSQNHLKPPLHVPKAHNVKEKDPSRSKTPSKQSSGNASSYESLLISSSNNSDGERLKSSKKPSRENSAKKSPFKISSFKEDNLAQTIHLSYKNSDSESDLIKKAASYIDIEKSKRLKRRGYAESAEKRGLKLLTFFINRRLVKKSFMIYKRHTMKMFVFNLLDKATKKLSNIFSKKLSISFKIIYKHAAFVQRIREKLTTQANKYLYKRFNQWKISTIQTRFEEKYKQQAWKSETHIYTLKTESYLKSLTDIIEAKLLSKTHESFSHLKSCYQKTKAYQVSLAFLFKTINSAYKATNHRKISESFQTLSAIANLQKKKAKQLEILLKNISKDINYRLSVCFTHWHSSIKQKNYDSLKTIAHVQILESLIRTQIKSAMSCFHIANRKSKQFDSEKYKKVSRFVKAISNYLSNEKQKSLIIWKCYLKVSKYKLSYVSCGLRHLTSITFSIKKKHFNSFFSRVQMYLSPRRRPKTGTMFLALKNIQTGLNCLDNFFKSKNVSKSAYFQILKQDLKIFKLQKKALNRVLRTQRIAMKMWLKGKLVAWRINQMK
ncbi:unnamed protein product [Blepharisma stoltei]|uniref:Abnormal spindle-like microcephaly-associated protein n=1 Tax=Blepharisma stoltei TaxID=1481888 RepID=A0AAU9IXV2_9CILI|nr:unnamed protein product [Blepharisma stoltei]